MRTSLPLLLIGFSASLAGCVAADEDDDLDTDSAEIARTIAGTYRLKVLNFNDCLKASAAIASGVGITHGSCTGAPTFSEKAVGAGIQIAETSSGLCLTVKGRSTGNSVPIVLAGCNGSTEQQFVPTVVSGTTRVLKSVLSGRCLDLSRRSNVFQQYTCDNSNDQKIQAVMLVAPGPTAPPSTPPSTPPSNAALRFPRLGGMLIGNPKNYDDPAYQAQIAKLDYAVLGLYEGWTRNGKKPATVTREIHARNPNIKLANYTIMTEVYQFESGTSTPLRAKLSSEKGANGVGDWWARDKAGNHTDWNNGTYGTYDVNVTLLTRPDANGDRWPQWKARYDYDQLLAGDGFDDWYCDNNFYRPRSDADWNGDGVNDSKDSLTVRNWYRDGQRAYYDKARTIAPNMKLMVNADSDLGSSTANGVTDNFTQFKGVLDYAFLEHAIGKSWSRETWAGFSSTLDWYHRTLKNVRQPGGVLFDAFLPSTTDYKSARYSFGLALLDDGMFSLSTDYNKIVWIDEFDVAGTRDTKWLGAAIDGPQTSAYSNGVYRRRFEHGMVLVNPKNNGTRTVTIESGYKRFVGKQAPSVNNGASATTVTLGDRDAILLVRQ